MARTESLRSSRLLIRRIASLAALLTALNALTVLAEPVSVRLDDLDVTDSGRGQSTTSEPGPKRFSVGRPVPGMQDVAGFTRQLTWSQTAERGPWQASVRIQSPGALGLRLGLQIRTLPGAATLSVSASATESTHTVTGRHINRSLRADRLSGEDTGRTNPYWLPLVQGDAVTLSIRLPADQDPSSVKIAVPWVAHFWRFPFVAVGQRPPAMDCEAEVSCFPERVDLANAVAMLLYTTEDGSSGSCSGTLIQSAGAGSDGPLFVTAHHCVPDQARASSIETIWFQRTEHCGGRARTFEVLPGGADLVVTSAATDTSVLRLRGTPPPEAVPAAGSARVPELGQAVVGIHNPSGSVQQIALGRITHFWSCADVAYCPANADEDLPAYIGVTWERGVTDSGSSGSGLFLLSGELIGVLTGGMDSCEDSEGTADYGRLDLTLGSGLSRGVGVVVDRDPMALRPESDARR